MSLAELSDRDIALSIWQALRRIESSISAGLDRPLPTITVPPPDFAEIVTAVTSLNGTGPTADEIARALADVLAPMQPSSPDGSEALGEVARALEKLDFRLRAVGTQAYGGGAVSLSPETVSLITGGVATSTAATVTSVGASATVTTLLAANPARLALTVTNDDTDSILHLKLGAAASLTSFTVKIGPDAYWEMPYRYTGAVSGIWDVASGGARLTELT